MKSKDLEADYTRAKHRPQNNNRSTDNNYNNSNARNDMHLALTTLCGCQEQLTLPESMSIMLARITDGKLLTDDGLLTAYRRPV